MRITIDGKGIEAAEGSSILEAALHGGVYIPHLCSHPDLEARGGCRLCSVEIEGIEEPVLACMTKAAEGMNISVSGEKADRIRKTSMELILATHPSECTGCPKYGKCELQSMYQFMGVSPERWRKQSRTLSNDSSNPLIQHLFTRCVRCGRCIRACQDLRGVKVLDYIKDQSGIHAGIPDGKSLKEAGCRFCGACIEVCPTGSIVDALGQIKEDCSYAESVVPCKAACPAHIDIPRYIRHIKDGEFDQAAAVIREKVPFPLTLGSICSHTCESSCKRGQLGAPVSICKLKLAAASRDNEGWKQQTTRKPLTGKKTAIIGAGPAGLTAAYYLARLGHEVTVYEENEKAGGQCRYGIPAYRLPDELLDKEIADILASGVVLKTSEGRKTPQELLDKGYHAVLAATGTHQGIKLPLEGNELDGVLLNTDFLKSVRMGSLNSTGDRVMVLGGGNVAFDCARTALRLGAKEVHITCLEGRDAMTADQDEIREGEEEGIILHDGHSFLRITGDQHVNGVEIQQIERFYFDDSRKAVIDLKEGTKEVIAVDQVIFAVGQKPAHTDQMGLELTHGSCIQVDGKQATSMNGVYAAGDVVTGTRSVIEAIAAGRKSAAEIDLFLGGDGVIDENLTDVRPHNPYLGTFPGFADLERNHPDIKTVKERICSFEACEQPFSEANAKNEASRCLQCDLRLDITKPKLWNEY
ncbi:MAG: FAD-dependent oxidoreductase [Lachnospiraceae bacterium]